MKRTVTWCDVCDKETSPKHRRELRKRWWEPWGNLEEVTHICDDCWGRFLVWFSAGGKT